MPSLPPPLSAPVADAPRDPRGGLLSASFLGLLATQLLGAVNDNVLRWLIIGLGKSHVAAENTSNVIMAGTACFVLPYLLLAAPAGFLADRYGKRTVIVACKWAEAVIMLLAVGAILLGNLYVMFVVVAAMGAQSALFGPSKLGSIPEMLRADRISAANGAMGLVTVMATAAGTIVGCNLADAAVGREAEWWWLYASVLVGFAAAGVASSLLIARLPAANPLRRFPWDMARQTWRDLKTLASDRAMLRVALGIMFFWSLGVLANVNIDQFAFEGGATLQKQTGPLLAALVIGVGTGSVLAGIWSGGKVELGILPLGAGGLAVCSMLLFTVEGVLVDAPAHYTSSYIGACALLVMLGISAGLFSVPLDSFMQHRSPPQHRGSILAASNFMTFGGMLVASMLFAVLRAPVLADDAPLFNSRTIFLLCGLMTIPVFLYIVWLIPQASIRFLVWLLTHTAYRVRVYGRENLPAEGGALLAANHVSWLDGALLLAASSRPVRIVIDADLIRGPLARWLARTMGAISIRPTPKATAAAIDNARAALVAGELVCIFPEGTMTRTGQLQAFKPGVVEILRGTSEPVIPVYLDELWGSIFSFRGGRSIWKWPRHWASPVGISFGGAVLDPSQLSHVRQAVQDLGAQAVQERVRRSMTLPRKFLRQCRRKLFRSKIADSTGGDLTGGSLLMRTLILRGLLLREVLNDDEQYVGILLPPSVPSVVANAAVAFAGRTSANLNYSVTSDVMNECIRQAGIHHVLTSRRVTEKFSDLKIDAELVYLEDFRDRVRTSDKLLAALSAFATPAFVLERLLGLTKIAPDDVMTVIFTSGSTGTPKGVLLTQANVLSNVEAVDQVIHLRRDDVILGILPFFHSFGFTITLWGVLGLNIKGAYHFSPLDPKQIGKLCQAQKGTILLSTPTFLRSYLRRVEPEEFRTLDVVVVGAEKMPIALADEFEAKFGVRPVEGYGTTELSPLVSVNIPPSRSPAGTSEVKEGTVGRPVPGVSAKVVDLDSGDDLSTDTPGMLLIRGPNVMKGYLNQPEKTAEVVRGPWYVTGDVAAIDADGFIRITGRESRFSKIGGEMVPHVRIEEELLRIVGGDHEHIPIAVSAVPDERKGERLVVLHTPMTMTPDEICRRLSEAGFPNLWIPGRDAFYEVEAIPVLGSGKLDLKGLRELAKEKSSV